MFTMAHSKYNASLLDSNLHLDAILQASGHGFLTKDVIPLFSKCQHYFKVHMILDCDNHRVGQTLAYSIDSLG
jgi:hypothetical protein